MKRINSIIIILVTLVMSALSLQGFAKPYEYSPADSYWTPSDKGQTIVLPEKLLREYDPVTIFFPDDRGPGAGGPEDNPRKFISMTYEHPGEFRWINPRTLQFKPASPWPVLKTFSWKIDGRFYDFFTVLSPPYSTDPYDQSTGLNEIKSITLRFKQEISVEDLNNILSLEVRPLPGLDARDSIWLNSKDYEIKKIERKNFQDNFQYMIQFKKSIGVGMKLLAHLRLSLNAAFSESELTYSFSTRNEFRIIDMGVGSYSLPVAVNGSRYNSEQALNGGDSMEVFLSFSDSVSEISFSQLKRVISFSPAVDNLTYSVYGNRLYIRGNFNREILYQALISSSDIKDQSGRQIKMDGGSEFYFFFPRRDEFLKWTRSEGVVERFGPKQMPMQGRSVSQADVRIYQVDPLDRRLWPFPSRPVSISETDLPPGPGEEPQQYVQSLDYIYESELKSHLRMMGSPILSRIINLPIDEKSGSAQFGLDLDPLLMEIAGKNAPGTYVIGFRDVKGGTYRQYVRIQVTDLSLLAVEEAGGVRLYVTSFRNALPQSGVSIRLQGYDSGDYSGNKEWIDLIKGVTDSKGMYFIPRMNYKKVIKRLIVSREKDILVFNPSSAVSRFKNNYWYEDDRQDWLKSLTYSVTETSAQYRGFVFTERPVYKPEEPVNLKAYVRSLYQGSLSFVTGFSKWYFQVYGPGSKQWKIPVEMTEQGSFYAKFEEKNLPTGYYYADLVGVKGNSGTQNFGRATFQKEAYKIPRFEVNIHGDKRVPMDKPFKVSLTADYYAGGKAVDQQVRWKVNQFPYTYNPTGIKGFLFSSDSRYSLHNTSFSSTGSIQANGRTDQGGSASLTIDPTLEPNAMPRLYVFEATVIGDDEQTVTATYDVVALPAFVLGLKVDRFIQKGDIISPQILALDVDQKLKPGVEITLRLIKREWHSHLRESPLNQGKPDYVTEQVDTVIQEIQVQSEKEAKEIPLKVPASGIYLVELEARDELGRVQSVSADVYVGGAGKISWEQQDEKLFRAVFDKSGKYKPGDTARVLLESPFPEAQALAIIERPDRLEYQWLEVRDSRAEFSIKVENNFAPSIPIHFMLITPRQVDAEGKILDKKMEDIGKPRTLAATRWLMVDPVENTLNLGLKHDKQSMPGRTMEVEISLADDQSKPLSGEVTLWMVDQAVLALGEEQSIDPLPSFMDNHSSLIQAFDFRNQAIGKLKVIEDPGGGYGDDEDEINSPSASKMDSKGASKKMEKESLLDTATVRKNFKTVAYYNASIQVGASGHTTIKIELPDNLTIFQIRAVAVSGTSRFGTAKSSVEIRLPLIVQTALPRFVRYGDEILAGGLGRVVYGKGGAGSMKIDVQGAVIDGKKVQDITWDDKKALKLFYPMKIDSPRYDDKGQLINQELIVKMAVSRDYDQAVDAFQVAIPILPDRDPVKTLLATNLAPGQNLTIPALEYQPRPGTLKQDLLFTYERALLSAIAGMDYLLEYPYGCLEQKLSKAFSAILLQKIYTQFGLTNLNPKTSEIFTEVMETIDQSRLPSGLYAYWPGSQGYIYLTSYVLEFLILAREAGFNVPGEKIENAKRVLKEALRSDYSGFVDGYHYQERVEALYALSLADYFPASYAQELGEKGLKQDLGSQSRILLTLAKNRYYNKELIGSLKKNLWDSTVFALYQGKEIFRGMQFGSVSWGGPLNQFEVKSLADIISALSYGEKYTGRLKLMVDDLVNMGGINGWGNTWVNGAAIRALSDYLANSRSPGDKYQLKINVDGKTSTLGLDTDTFATSWQGQAPQGAKLELSGTSKEKTASVQIRTSYVPLGRGDEVKSESKGFVVEKELLQIADDNSVSLRQWIKQTGRKLELKLGEILEQHIQVVNPQKRYYAVVVCPLAAGTEPMNPQLRTSGPEARPTGTITLAPTYVQYLDSEVRYYYNELPKGTYDFYFRVRAMTQGSFVEPGAFAELMYEEWVRGNSPGLRIEIKP